MQVIAFLSVLALTAFVVFSIRMKWWRKDIDYKFPRVLMYHMISDHLPKNKSKFNRLRVKPSEFEKQIKWLKNNGFKSYFLREISASMPEKSVIITFDDGYRDNLIIALKILQKYDFKATIFIVCNRFNRDWAKDKDLNSPSEELNNEDMLSDDDVKTLLKSNLIEIGSHTLNHANLPTLNSLQKHAEIANSKLEIEKKFGIVCESFAYPFGFFDDESVDLVKNSGYKFAVTTQNAVYDSTKFSPHRIPRIMISGRGNLLHFILKIRKGRSR